MLILDMQEGTALESTAAAHEAEAMAPASPGPVPALHLQEHRRPLPERPDPELVRRTLERWPG